MVGELLLDFSKYFYKGCSPFDPFIYYHSNVLLEQRNADLVSDSDISSNGKHTCSQLGLKYPPQSSSSFIYSVIGHRDR